MFETTSSAGAYDSIVGGYKKHLVLDRVVGLVVGDHVRIEEVDLSGHRTRRGVFARITYVETTRGANGPMMVASVEVRMSTDRMPAIVLPRE